MTATDAISAAAIRLQPIALFAKLDGATDYAWQAGRDRLPSGAASLLETLGQHAAVTQAQILLLFRDDAGRHWLARTYTRLVDAVGRLSPAVEVLRIVEPEALSPELCLRLVSEALTWRTLEHAEAFTCHPPVIEHDPRPLDPGDTLRARLGLRLSLAPLQALGLVRRPGPWRYRGICYAWLPSGACVPWLESLHPFLCVNFDAPVPTPEEQRLLRVVREHEPRDAEWEVLDRLPDQEVRRALAWLAEGSPVPAPARDGDPLAPWVVTWLRRQAMPGPALLDALVASTGGQSLHLETVKAAAPGLSEEAIKTLLAAGAEELSALNEKVVEELAQGGYLGSETGGRLPLERWVSQATGSEAVKRSAVERLERAEMSRVAAHFLLDLPEEEDTGDLPDPATAQKGVLLGLSTPQRRIAAALERVSSPAQIARLAAVAEAFPGWGEAFGRSLRGAEDAAQALDPEMLVSILAVRQRILADSSSWRGVLAGLVRNNQSEAARKLLAELRNRPGLGPPAEIEAVLRARLGLAAPAPAPLPSILEPLARDGLARPEDIVLPDGDGSRIPDWARLWPATVPLARLFEGAGAGPLPEVPAGWRAAVRRGLAPKRLARWIQASRDLPREAIVAWAAEVLEIPDGRLQTLLDGRADRRSAREGLDVAERVRDWLPALLIGLPRQEALRVLAGQARLDLFAGDESGAAELVHALLPDDGEAAHELATYALCRVGPIPQLDGVPPDLATAVVDRLDPLEAVDAAFRMTGVELNSNESWLAAVVGHVERSGAVCPQRGYLKRQVKRHPALAERLSRLPGWEQLTPGLSIRIRLALGFLKLLNLTPEDLVDERSARKGTEVQTASAARRKR